MRDRELGYNGTARELDTREQAFIDAASGRRGEEEDAVVNHEIML